MLLARRKSVRSWDYANLRIDALVAPASVLTNVLGLLLAVALGAGQHEIEAIIVAFTYYSHATRIMFEFNQIYRQLESSLTEAAQFTALLLTSPTVVDPIAPEPLRPESSDVRFERVTFAHAGGSPRRGSAEPRRWRAGGCRRVCQLQRLISLCGYAANWPLSAPVLRLVR